MGEIWSRVYGFFLLFFFSFQHLDARPEGGLTRFYHFQVEITPVTMLCKTSHIVTINGKFPGPAIHAREDDRVVVKVTNRTPYNITIHWHGVRQLRTCWSDGPSYITQCPIQGGQSFTHRFTLLNQRGTLFWHAHVSWLRATVHGPIIIHPKSGVPYPFDTPHEEHILVLGEYWLQDIQELEQQILESGGGPPGSDAYLINGHPGPLYNCSQNDTYTLNVSKGNTYLLRIINAAVNIEHFFAIANHTMTVVEADGEYTKPFQTSYISLTPGQTYNVLLTADQPLGQYYMGLGPYMPSEDVPYLHTPSYGLLNYVGSTKTRSISAPKLPGPKAIALNQEFTSKVKSLMDPVHHFVPVPLTVDKELFFSVGLNVFKCNSSPDHCQGPGGGIFAASVNNITFRKPGVSILEAHYRKLDGYFTKNFPDRPPRMYDFVYAAPNTMGDNTQATLGTRVSVVEYGQTVQLVLQGTGMVSAENHPIHLHGYSFYVIGSGLGDFDPRTARFNLVDPPYRNTVGVPMGGWVVIRFKADNPGVWFMHCHLDVHTTWGLSMAFLVKNGKDAAQSLPPPPPDLPPC